MAQVFRYSWSVSKCTTVPQVNLKVFSPQSAFPTVDFTISETYRRCNQGEKSQLDEVPGVVRDIHAALDWLCSCKNLFRWFVMKPNFLKMEKHLISWIKLHVRFYPQHNFNGIELCVILRSCYNSLQVDTWGWEQLGFYAGGSQGYET